MNSIRWQINGSRVDDTHMKNKIVFIIFGYLSGSILYAFIFPRFSDVNLQIRSFLETLYVHCSGEYPTSVNTDNCFCQKAEGVGENETSSGKTCK